MFTCFEKGWTWIIGSNSNTCKQSNRIQWQTTLISRPLIYSSIPYITLKWMVWNFFIREIQKRFPNLNTSPIAWILGIVIGLGYSVWLHWRSSHGSRVVPCSKCLPMLVHWWVMNLDKGLMIFMQYGLCVVSYGLI